MKAGLIVKAEWCSGGELVETVRAGVYTVIWGVLLVMVVWFVLMNGAGFVRAVADDSLRQVDGRESGRELVVLARPATLIAGCVWDSGFVVMHLMWCSDNCHHRAEGKLDAVQSVRSGVTRSGIHQRGIDEGWRLRVKSRGAYEGRHRCGE